MQFRRLSTILPATLGACSVLAFLCLLPQLLLAATITVNGQTGDPPGSSCDLVEAIGNVNDDANTNADCTGVGAYGADSIVLTVDVTLNTVDNMADGDGPNGLPQVVGTIEIQGNDFTIRRDVGAPDFRIFNVALNTGDLTLMNTTVSGGSVPGQGGGIYNRGTTVLTDSIVADNSAGTIGGGISNEDGTVSIGNSTLSGNSAASSGGGISNRGSSSYAFITRSTIVGNTAYGNAGGILNSVNALAWVENSTVTGNSAFFGGAILNQVDATLVLFSSTLSGNSASSTGGGGGIHNSSTAEVYGSTLARNSGTTVKNQGGTMQLFNSIVAANNDDNCEGAITDGGGNLADDSTCGAGIPPTLTGFDPTLRDNGGPTLTHALLPGSNAIDNANNLSPPFDQRGAAREGGYDSGAFEFLTCDDLILSGEVVANTRTETNCQNIVADVTVEGTGDLTLRAGRSISIGNGTSVLSSGALTLAVDGGLQIAKTVFVTSTSYDGNLGGLLGADAKCQARAQAAQLQGVYKAWLSDSAEGPRDTFEQATCSPTCGQPYYRVDGVRIADNWGDLADGTLQAPIQLDEFGDAGPVVVWTSTLGDGSKKLAGFHCGNWASTGGDGSYGLAFSSTSLWTDAFAETFCSGITPVHLYCFEQ